MVQNVFRYFLKIGKICVICTNYIKLLIFCEFMQEILSLRSRMTELGFLRFLHFDRNDTYCDTLFLSSSLCHPERNEVESNGSKTGGASPSPTDNATSS